MQSDFIARIIALVQKHGDRVVVADPSVGRAVVVLDLAEYERLRDATNPVIASASDHSPLKPSAKVEAISIPLIVTTPPQPTVPIVIPAEAGIQKKEPPQTNTPDPFANLLAKTIENPPQAPSLTDLTQEQLIDKINRDIGAWKTAQDRKRTDELKTALTPADVPANPPATVAKKATEPRPEAPRSQPAPPIEDEERFFLEPIE